MKLLVASDIHGSYDYAEKIIKAFHQEKADRLLLLGDFLYHGPRNPLPKGYDPLKVAELLNQYADQIWAVRGNCDSEVDQMVLDFDIMADYLPISINQIDIIASHGHIYNPEHPPKYSRPFLFLFGHIHIPIAEKADFGYIGNPGSASLPKAKTNSYGVLDGNTWMVKDFEGEILESIEIDFG